MPPELPPLNPVLRHEPALLLRAQPVRVVVLDVDGVLTDGVIALDDRGVELKHFHVRDGSALSFWRKAGKRAAILSGRWARNVERRAGELGIRPVIQGMPMKAEPFRRLLAELDVAPAQVCVVGDDLPDLPILMAAGLAACPSDAVPEVQAVAHLVATAPGGRGAVREVVETILRHQGSWESILDIYRRSALER
jgi:3-deoxy-D-manno-octulosonate 8-phosphate phosphatase (KDO 8-P phosphatase)